MRSHEFTASYKGVTITAWAEPQRDGRFLPRAAMLTRYRHYGGAEGFGFGPDHAFDSGREAAQWAVSQCMTYLDER